MVRRRSSKRKTLAKGIYEDASGRFIRISVAGKPVDLRREKDVRAADGTLIERGRSYRDRDVSWLRDERIRRQAEATLATEDRVEGETAFEADVERFLHTVSGKGHRLNVAGYMAHWARAFEKRQRNTITELEVQTAFAAIDRGASTKRHLRRALVKFYEAMNGVSGYNPARVLTPPPKPQDDARSIPYAMIERIFAALQPSRARARLKLIAYVGLPQNQIAKLQPSDLRLNERTVIVRPRRKGAGVEGRALPLSPAGVEALTEFAALNAFGSFQNAQLVRTFKLGAKRSKVSLSEDARPYDLRHSFLTEVYRQTGDLYAVSELAMHATLAQTARYAKGAVSERATKAIQSVPRFLTTTKRKNLPIRSSSVASKSKASRTKGRKKTRKKKPNSRGKL